MAGEVQTFGRRVAPVSPAPPRARGAIQPEPPSAGGALGAEAEAFAEDVRRMASEGQIGETFDVDAWRVTRKLEKARAGRGWRYMTAFFVAGAIALEFVDTGHGLAGLLLPLLFRGAGALGSLMWFISWRQAIDKRVRDGG